VKDWSGSLVTALQACKKAEAELVMIHGGLVEHRRAELKAQAEEHLLCMHSAVIDALTWLRAQR
jgi:protein-disulfide isomerase-like protein with CxxC motif